MTAPPSLSPDRRGPGRVHVSWAAGRSWGRSVSLVLMLLAAHAAPGSGQAAVDAPATSPRILVSIDARMLWLVAAGDTLLEAPVAVGRRESFRYRGRRYDWTTPRGERRVLGKRRDPVWTVPEWHYLERAANEGLELVHLAADSNYPLRDGSWLEVRDGAVVRARADRYWIVPRGREIVIDGTLYVPPPGTLQRRVPSALGTRALDLGDGYLIHGTHEYNEDSIGDAVSHGCIRMRNEDIERLFELVETGVPVFIH